MCFSRFRLVFATIGLSAGICAGCGSFGPKTLERTHGQYNEAIHEVEQEEFLKNLVRMRYHDTPTSLNVASIAAQYELSGQAEARPFFSAPNPGSSYGNSLFKTFTTILPDVLVLSANRPTLSLMPGDDGTSVRQFLTPISADSLLFLIQSGWSVSTIMRVWVERLNGVPNADTLSNPPRGLIPDYERFQRIAELLQIMQDREFGSIRFEERATEVSGPLPVAAMTAAAAVEAAKGGLEYRSRDDGKTWVLVRPGSRLVLAINPPFARSPEVVELESLLNLQPTQQSYEVMTTTDNRPDPLIVPSPASPVLWLMPRSTGQVYYFLSSGVEVPVEHLQCGLVKEPVDQSGQVFNTTEVTRGLFQVHVANGHKPPPCAFVAVRYRDHWFYIDDRDQPSKTTFGMVLQLSRLDFKKQQLGAGPFLTLPAGR